MMRQQMRSFGQKTRLVLSAGAAAILIAFTQPARAETILDIEPAPELAPGQAWASVAEMLMVYYDVPNTGPGEMQCSLAFYLTGTQNCYKAPEESEFSAVSRVVKGYSQFAYETFGELPVAMRWEEAKTIQPADIIQEIKFERPVLVQIEPVPNEGESNVEKRAVLIVGFDGNPENLQLILNDPKVYQPTQNPYLEFGGRIRDNSGQYQIGYADFLSFLKWSATLYKIKPD
ncbi:hypothetical protein [Dongia sp.]|jgi:hypothetical protein|uniref:hypothetical protein n=1 Tax=Dongia sp. TaxID=1977262 RepID=UPI0034A398CA